MYLMELIIKVFKIKFRDLLTLCINSFFIILFYYLLFKNSEIIYPLLLSIFVISVYFIFEVIRYKNFLEKLKDSKRSPNYSNFNTNPYEEDVFSSISILHKTYLNKIYTLEEDIKERDCLFSQWIHNMKTSITVIDLACEKSSLNMDIYKCIEDIKEENNSLKKNLEECLNILRLDDFSRDYLTSSFNLRNLVNNVVNSKKREFIYKGVFPKVDIDEDIYVYTDKKWCSYMLEQIISNSIKYSTTSSNIIEICAVHENNIIELIIKDNGIGISQDDLSRIFDPFFTGNNGRNERTSTGIGLYMVKLICKKLEHTIEIESKLNVGTKVKIIFKTESII